MALGALIITLIIKHLSRSGGAFYGEDYWN
jgi:hypothetical protein